ncbi:MAG TPA: BON domain-containing protein [Steroidobacteraceae bacterium]|jgi:osmotically-inducible protein OsmY|nr:BON domain-containing protein [Steroidobacteraceae bacterium]
MRSSFLAATLMCSAALALLCGCATYTHNEPTQCTDSACLADAKISEDVETHLERNPQLHPPGLVHVRTVNQVVYLSGEVRTPSQKDAAEVTARGVRGVNSVVNSINVRADAGA